MMEAGLIVCIVVLWIMVGLLDDRITKLERELESRAALHQEGIAPVSGR